MARPLRIQYENAKYHIISREHRKESIYRDTKEIKTLFLQKLGIQAKTLLQSKEDSQKMMRDAGSNSKIQADASASNFCPETDNNV
jgi:hypothetical protein